MKKSLLILFFISVGFASSQAQSINLPNECQKILNKNFRGWKLAKIQKEIVKYHRRNNFPYAPNLVKGDWNGDGKIDYAVLIEQGKLENSRGEVIGEHRFTVVFVRTQKSFKSFLFNGGDYIELMKKDSKDYNYETDKNFRYKTDAIFDGIWEKAGVSYVWKKGKFVEIVTSD